MRALLVSAAFFATPVAPLATAAQQSPDTWLEIREPTEWRGEGTRGLGISVGHSIRIVGVAHHPAGIRRVFINGARATLSGNPSGGVRFVGYVTVQPSLREVEVAVYPGGGRPLVRGFGVRSTPAATAARPEVVWADPEGEAVHGQRWAVIVGISEYQDARIRPLRYADADARALYAILASEAAGLGGNVGGDLSPLEQRVSNAFEMKG